ncbi:hypothetical protein LIER_29938 [Lithospermum erythrorhizon]|uniref:Germin-like protein n=1 Tax=Lithospermum erythrorhizon TaxID=34254 RepID=A0AAV3RKX5_LITER
MASFGNLVIPLIGMFIILSLTFFNKVSAGDPDMLQDVCVADMKSGILVNGFVCKANISPNDFFSAILATPGVIDKKIGSIVTAANVMTAIPGLNTLGISMARIDFAPGGGENPPHTHPRATEILIVLEGQLDVGFVTTNNVLIAKNIKKGEVFVFPRGLIHFQVNNGYDPAVAIAALNSQLPGTQRIDSALYAIPDYSDVTKAAFKTENKEVNKKMKSRIAP